MSGPSHRYVNYSRGEFVTLTEPCGLLGDGPADEHAVLRCSVALAWLISPPHPDDDGYRGRWAPTYPPHVQERFSTWDPARSAEARAARARATQDVRVARDVDHDFAEMAESLLNITPGLLQSMLDQVPILAWGYPALRHELRIVQRVPRSRTGALEPHARELAEAVSATCRCGWATGPIRGEGREGVLELSVADHANRATWLGQDRRS